MTHLSPPPTPTLHNTPLEETVFCRKKFHSYRDTHHKLKAEFKGHIKSLLAMDLHY